MLTKDQIREKKQSSSPAVLPLPDGTSVYAMPVGFRLFSDYQACLRDEDGDPIGERAAFSDDLLVARVLVDESGNRLFTDEEVLAGEFDWMPPVIMASILQHAYSFVNAREDREKKSSATEPGDPS